MRWKGGGGGVGGRCGWREWEGLWFSQSRAPTASRLWEAALHSALLVSNRTLHLTGNWLWSMYTQMRLLRGCGRLHVSACLSVWPQSALYPDKWYLKKDKRPFGQHFIPFVLGLKTARRQRDKLKGGNESNFHSAWENHFLHVFPISYHYLELFFHAQIAAHVLQRATSSTFKSKKKMD